MKYIVICKNDFPYEVMPQGTHMFQALDYCQKLQDADACNTPIDKVRSHFHAHTVSESTYACIPD